MKSKICKILFLLHLCTFVSAKENLSVENYINIGTKHNSIKEIVLQSAEKTSELNWKTIVAPLFSDELLLKLYNFDFLLGFNTVIPIKSGYVEDRDWLFSDKNLLSNYSYHKNFIDKDYSIYFKISYNFLIFSKRLILTPLFGLTYSNEKYSAKDGFYQYSLVENKTINSDTTKTTLCGTIMSYEISAFQPICFINMNFKINDKNSLIFGFDFSPYMFIDSVDTHILRLVEFYDSMKGGFGFNLKTGYEFKISDKCNLNFFISYLLLTTSGISGSRQIGENTNFIRDEDVRSGLKKSSFEAKIGFVWKLI